jgi:hypothetical protein
MSKIVSIEQRLIIPDNIKVMLKKGIRSERLFNDHRIIVTLDIDHPKYVFDRWMWESEYLRFDRLSPTIIRPDDDTIGFRMALTLSEALDFIYKATPPVLQDKIPESTTNVYDVIECLKTFLLEDNGGQQKYYMSLFEQMTHLKPTNIPSKIDTRYCDAIRQRVSTGTIVHIQWNKSDSDEGIYTFHCNNKSDMMNLLRSFQSYCGKGFTIMDRLYDPNSGYYIQAYMEHKPSDYLMEIKRISYEWMK